jgi:hypothetical protein
LQKDQIPETRVASLCSGPKIRLSQAEQVLGETVHGSGQEHPDWMMWRIDEEIEADEAWLLTLQST